MALPLDLQKLPPQALDVIRYLEGQDAGADVATILGGTGLSERAFGKAIRRLVTRYYVQLVGQGVYALSQIGKQAAQDIRAYDAGTPGEAPAAAAGETPAAAPASAERHARRLSVWVAQELVKGSKSVLLVGFDARSLGAVPLQQPAQVILRLSAPGCTVEPVERPLEVAVDKAAGPVQYRVMPRREGSVRIKIEVQQQTALHDFAPLGGMYFDIPVSEFPTARSAEFRALGVSVGLFPGQA